MATLEVITPAPAPAPKSKYILHLNLEEINTLRAVLCRIGGTTGNSPRGHAQNIADALCEKFGGFSYNNPEYALIEDTPRYSHIEFKSYPQEKKCY